MDKSNKKGDPDYCYEASERNGLITIRVDEEKGRSRKEKKYKEETFEQLPDGSVKHFDGWYEANGDIIASMENELTPKGGK